MFAEWAVGVAVTFHLKLDPTKHSLTDKGSPGFFKRKVSVEPGKIEYKFVVDGEWQIDSACPKWSPNEFGTLNSVIEVT